MALSKGGMEMRSIFFCSDTLDILENYRGMLMSEVASIYPISKGGWFDGFNSFLNSMFNMLFSKIYVSSNLRSNFISLIFFWKRGLLILNGFGRYEKNARVRRGFIILCRVCRTNKHVIAQSYRDYRYLRRSGLDVSWIPGSGGTRYVKGVSGEALVVTRSSKIECVSSSLVSFFCQFDLPLVIGGCRDDFWQKHLAGVNFRSLGFVDDKGSLYSVSDTFIQPDGYGEGIAHSLVDAICSGFRIYIAKGAYIKTGIYLFCRKENIRVGGIGEWMIIEPSFTENLQKYFIIEKTNILYANLIKNKYSTR